MHRRVYVTPRRVTREGRVPLGLLIYIYLYPLSKPPPLPSETIPRAEERALVFLTNIITTANGKFIRIPTSVF